MSPAAFRIAFWTYMRTVEPRLVPSDLARGYGGVTISGRISVWGNFKSEFEGRPDVQTGRYVVVSLYTDHRTDESWRQLVRRVQANPPWLASMPPVIDGCPDTPASAQIIFEHRVLGEFADEVTAIPDLAAWMALAWRTLLAYTENPGWGDNVR